MGCIGQKALLRGDGIVEPTQQIIDGVDQRHHLQRHILVVDGREVFGLARANALFEPMQRLDAARQRQPYQQRRQWQDDKLRQHHALDDFRGQHAALFARFGNLHQGVGLAGQRHAHPDIGHTQVYALVLLVAQQHRSGGRVVLGRGWARQVAVTGQIFALDAADLKEHRVRFVGPQDLAGRLRQIELHLPRCTMTSWARAWALYSSARSKGLLARPCATSQVSARLTGHSSSSGVSIQSRISPKRDRCSR